MKTGNVTLLPDRQKNISTKFARIVREKLTHHLKKIVLFGSQARGDFTETSDYDILLIVDTKTKWIQDLIIDACVEITDTYYELIGCLVFDEAEWEQKKRFPIGLNILKEGVEI